MDVSILSSSPDFPFCLSAARLSPPEPAFSAASPCYCGRAGSSLAVVGKSSVTFFPIWCLFGPVFIMTLYKSLLVFSITFSSMHFALRMFLKVFGLA